MNGVKYFIFRLSYNDFVKNSRPSDLQCTYIGTLAMDVLSTEKIAMVLGVTSRGIFLKFDNNKMIFLSYESYRGPMTVNLPGDSQLFPSHTSGATVTIAQDRIQFSNSDISISTSNAKVWNLPLILETPLQTEDRKNLIRQLALDVYSRKKTVGLSEMLPVLTGFDPEKLILDDQFQLIRQNIEKIRDKLAQGDLISMFRLIQPLLGMGSGLTPLGDDFVMGLLLSLNRWASIFQPGNNLSSLNTKVVEAGYRGTTILSANLIECAALGLADERLIHAVDYLATGKTQRAEPHLGLLSWGNSSGIDALVGMLTAFLAI